MKEFFFKETENKMGTVNLTQERDNETVNKKGTVNTTQGWSGGIK